MIKPATHLFVCGTALPKGGCRDAEECTCDSAAALEILLHLRERVEAREMYGVKVSACECMNFCEYGPVVVVYPAGTWYSNVTRDQVDEILNAVWNNAILKSFSGCATCASKS